METIGSYEAKTHFPRLLRKVEKGKTYSITRNGVPVAVLSPCESNEEKPDLKSVTQRIKELRKYSRLPSDTSIKDLINEGRRY